MEIDEQSSPNRTHVHRLRKPIYDYALAWVGVQIACDIAALACSLTSVVHVCAGTCINQ